MTKRLEEAVKQLTPEQVEQLVRLAEEMATSTQFSAPEKSPTFSWAGAVTDAPERSGVEAARRANEIVIELLEKSRPK